MQLIFTLPVLFLAALSNASPVRRADGVSAANSTAKCPDYCAGTAYDPDLSDTYVCGDSRLGPKRLPTKLPLGDLVDDYDRFGGLCPGQFLAKWYNATAGSYIYPPQDGFQLNTDGERIQGNITLPVGFLIDRFGSEYGAYTSPYAAPYIQRALPPSNLDTPQTNPTYVSSSIFHHPSSIFHFPFSVFHLSRS